MTLNRASRRTACAEEEAVSVEFRAATLDDAGWGHGRSGRPQTER